jgi:hypothetical protein
VRFFGVSLISQMRDCDFDSRILCVWKHAFSRMSNVVASSFLRTPVSRDLLALLSPDKIVLLVLANIFQTFLERGASEFSVLQQSVVRVIFLLFLRPRYIRERGSLRLLD